MFERPPDRINETTTEHIVDSLSSKCLGGKESEEICVHANQHDDARETNNQQIGEKSTSSRKNKKVVTDFFQHGAYPSQVLGKLTPRVPSLSSLQSYLGPQHNYPQVEHAWFHPSASPRRQ